MPVHVVVLAGGSGTRLWPVSRGAVPKHLLPLGPGGQTLLRGTVERVLPMGGTVHVVTVAAQAQACRDALAGLPLGEDPVITEPVARGTGPALGLAMHWIARLDPEAVVCSVHADHHVGDASAYREALWAGAGWAVATDGLATVGLAPAHPATGFGYVALDAPLPAARWRSPAPGSPLDAGAAALPAHHAAGFVEKPSRAVAEEYVAGGKHLWNTGLFAWPVSAFLRELRRAAPDVDDHLAAVAAARAAGDEAAASQRYAALGGVAVEPLVLERTDALAVVRAGFAWSDLGSWSDLREARVDEGAADEDGNVVDGDGLTVGAQGCLVEARGGRLVAVVGAQDLCVVDTGDAVLVVPAAQAQRVRDVVERLRATGRLDLV